MKPTPTPSRKRKIPTVILRGDIEDALPNKRSGSPLWAASMTWMHDKMTYELAQAHNHACTVVLDLYASSKLNLWKDRVAYRVVRSAPSVKNVNEDLGTTGAAWRLWENPDETNTDAK